jgi:hypothetical protein
MGASHGSSELPSAPSASPPAASACRTVVLWKDSADPATNKDETDDFFEFDDSSPPFAHAGGAASRVEFQGPAAPPGRESNNPNRILPKYFVGSNLAGTMSRPAQRLLGACQLSKMSPECRSSYKHDLSTAVVSVPAAGTRGTGVDIDDCHLVAHAALNVSAGMPLPQGTPLYRDVTLSPLLSQCFGSSLAGTGVTDVASLKDFIKGGTGLETREGFMVDQSHKTVMFSAVPFHHDQASLLNVRNEEEFLLYDSNGTPTKCNGNYWNNHKLYRNLTNKRDAAGEPIKFCFMELAMMFPQWTINQKTTL